MVCAVEHVQRRRRRQRRPAAGLCFLILICAGGRVQYLNSLERETSNTYILRALSMLLAVKGSTYIISYIFSTKCLVNDGKGRF